MSTTLFMAIWVASATMFEAALPFAGGYTVRQFPNSDAGLEQFLAWGHSSGHDRIDIICVAITGTEETPAARFWRDVKAKRVFYMSPLQLENYAKKRGMTSISARTVAEVCGEIFPDRK